MHDELQGDAIRPEVAWVLSGIEQVVDAGFIDDDAARVGVEVQIGFASVMKGNAVVLKLCEVLGGDEVP